LAEREVCGRIHEESAKVCDLLYYRYFDVTWDLGEVEREWKEKILAGNSLVNRLLLP
jgi:hypothetical protein